MKKITYIKTAVLSLTSMAMLSSCLKDDSHFVNFAGSKPLVEIPAVTGVVGTGEFEAEAFNITTTPTPLNLQINVAAPNPLKTALTVKLSVDQTALDNYNSANGTSYTLLPAADYSSSLTVTIPANQYSANLVININTSLIDPSQSYVLPLTITDGGGQQISNYKTILYNVQVKNAYDGEYTVTGTLTDNTSAAITGSYPEDADLVTQGANSVAMYDTYWSNFCHSINSNGSYYGSYAPVFTFSGNSITSVTNYYGQFSGSHVRSAALDPTGVNAITAGTPGQAGFVFQVSYLLQQGNPAATRTQFVETWTYVGPR